MSLSSSHPSTIVIRGGRLIDPLLGTDTVGDIWIHNGHIVAEKDVGNSQPLVIDAHGLIVSPGFVDCRVSLGEPGFEEDETIATGTAAALAGGFTLIASGL